MTGGAAAHATRREILERNALIALFKNLEEHNLGKFLAGALGLAVRRTVAASGIAVVEDDSPSALSHEVPAQTLSPILGADAFVRSIDELTPSRTRIQERRLVRDEALFSLFGDTSRSLDADPSIHPVADALANSLRIVTAQGRIRVLVVTSDLIGPKMAGPAIRAWNMSEQLAYRNDVRLVTSTKPGRASTRFEVVYAGDDHAMQEHEEWADVIVIQGYVLHQYRCLAQTEKILVADIYDPLHLEQLEQARQARFEDWNSHVINAADVLNGQIGRADYLLCASDKQRDFWLGQLAAVGRVNAMTYEADNALRELIDVAPFGLDPVVPAQERHAIKGAIPGIGPDDKVLLWGGGIYDWFDTDTLLRAMAKVTKTHPNARLFFLGVAHPNPGVPMMKAQARTFELADSLGLTDRVVFFNREWVAFDDRHNYLLDADAGVSTHYEHIETAFSFRTRILDYLWAGLPMVTTAGDGFADLIQGSPLGVTVPERDVDALAAGIIKVLYDVEFRAEATEKIADVRQDFAWSRALAPLTAFCAAPRSAPDRIVSTHGRVLRMPDPAAEAIRSRHHGLGKYGRLSLLYLRREGVLGFVKRARFRLGV
ncbi:glycosyltransferase family 4 protein [Microbacterium laevaniformans]|uniref:glycosyltransferase family 4 protein n=1 Tax=Microbacterium laevaniformans TaxID=36807 RepID=UPI00195B722E|nr:glycosyltransferase family 4 protein [Microbacterium laevaniformans]